jgi:hypothetical protein
MVRRDSNRTAKRIGFETNLRVDFTGSRHQLSQSLVDRVVAELEAASNHFRGTTCWLSRAKRETRHTAFDRLSSYSERPAPGRRRCGERPQGNKRATTCPAVVCEDVDRRPPTRRLALNAGLSGRPGLAVAASSLPCPTYSCTASWAGSYREPADRSRVPKAVHAMRSLLRRDAIDRVHEVIAEHPDDPIRLDVDGDRRKQVRRADHRPRLGNCRTRGPRALRLALR